MDKQVRAPKAPRDRREYLAEWRLRNPEKYKAQQERAHAKRMANPEELAEVNRQTRERLGPEYWRQWHQGRKRAIIERYGGKCECCGETQMEFLSMDHVNGGGGRERLAIGQSGVVKYLFASEERLPGYRVLCMNCQFGYMHGRTCPHQQAAS
jgi:hypothetical protein